MALHEECVLFFKEQSQFLACLNALATDTPNWQLARQAGGLAALPRVLAPTRAAGVGQLHPRRLCCVQNIFVIGDLHHLLLPVRQLKRHLGRVWGRGAGVGPWACCVLKAACDGRPAWTGLVQGASRPTL